MGESSPRPRVTRSSRHPAKAAQLGNRAQICVTKEQFCKAAPRPDSQSPDLTGFYQERRGGGQRPRFTMQVNQAGDHLRVWVRKVMHGGEKGDPRRWQFFGRRRAVGGDAFRLYADVFNWDYDDGDISGNPSAVVFKGSGVTGGATPEIEFARCTDRGSDQPVYADRMRLALEAEGGSKGGSPAHSEYYRLPQYDRERIGEAATSHELKRLVDAFLNQPRWVSGGGRGAHEFNKWNERILELDNYIATHIFHRRARPPATSALGVSDGSPESWHPSDEGAVLLVALEALATHEHKPVIEDEGMLDWFAEFLPGQEPSGRATGGHTLLDCLYDVQRHRTTSIQAGDGGGHDEEFAAIAKLLKIAVPRKAEPYTYKFHFEGAVFDAKFIVGIKVISGTMDVYRDGVLLDPFEFSIGGLRTGAGLSAGSYEKEIEVQSFAYWTPDDLPGLLKHVDLSASAGAGGGIPSAGTNAGVIVVHGSERHPPLILDISSAPNIGGPKAEKRKKWGAGVGAGGGLGRIWATDEPPPAPTVPDPELAPVVAEYTRKLSERQKVHFLEGDSLLSPWGRHVLGMFCADELKTLRSGAGELVVEGYTDPEGSAESNQRLAKHRAENVVQALEDIAGALRLEHQEVKGPGRVAGAGSWPREGRRGGPPVATRQPRTQPAGGAGTARAEGRMSLVPSPGRGA